MTYLAFGFGQQLREQALPAQRGEAALWRAVIDRAFDDACGYCGGENNHRNKIRIIETAARWLLDGGRDMRFVCDMAGLHPQAVKNRAAAEIERTAASPPARKRHKNVRHVRAKTTGRPRTEAS